MLVLRMLLKELLFRKAVESAYTPVSSAVLVFGKSRFPTQLPWQAIFALGELDFLQLRTPAVPQLIRFVAAVSAIEAMNEGCSGRGLESSLIIICSPSHMGYH